MYDYIIITIIIMYYYYTWSLLYTIITYYYYHCNIYVSRGYCFICFNCFIIIYLVV